MSPRESLQSKVHLLPQRDQDFAASLLSSRLLSEKQLYWVGKLIERADAVVASPVATAEIDNVAGIVALLNKGRTSLKNPKISFFALDQHLQLTIAGDRARCPGSINVCEADGDGWFGRIHQDGKFEPSRRVTAETTTAITAALQAFAADPQGVALAYGRRTGNCCFCCKPLVDPVSVHVGYGPICAKRYELPHRHTGLTTEQVDAEAEALAA